MQADRVLETCLYAENLEETASFYARVLGMSPFARVEHRHVFFRCGQSVLLLFNPRQTARATGEVPPHGSSGAGHVAFAMHGHEVDRWRSQFAAHGVAIEAEIDWPSGGHSLYVRDPAGNSVELTTSKTWGLSDDPPLSAPDYRSILDPLPVGVFVVVPDSGEILLANQRAAFILGAEDANAFVGRSVLDLVQPHRRTEALDYLRHVEQAMPLPEFFHERLELANGRQIDLELAGGLLVMEGRRVIQLAFRDITDRTQAEDALRQSEELFRNLAETADAAIFLYRDEKFLYVNAALCRISGYSFEELLSRPFWEFVHPDFRDQVRARAAARQQGRPIEASYELAILTKGGETRWMQHTGSLISYQGAPAVLGTSIDITARKKMEQALQESEARFRTLAHVSPASITVHVDDRIIYANPAAFRLTGMVDEDLRAVDLWSLLHPDSLDTMRRAYELMGQQQSVSDLKLQIVIGDGTTKWLDVNWSPFELNGKPAWVITAYDITALVEAEQALRSHARRLEVLSEIDRLGLLAKTRQEVAALALDHIRALIACDRASIVQVDAAHRTPLVLAVSPSDSAGVPVGHRFSLEQWKIVHDSVAQGVHYVADLDSLSSLTLLQRTVRRAGLRSYIAVPLAVQDQLVGVLGLAAQQPDAFDAGARAAAMDVARRLALVMVNAQLFGELETSHQQLAELSQRLVSVQEAERRYIARELHDEVGQTLTALGIHLGLAGRTSTGELRSRLTEAQRLVEDLAERVRRMSLDLRPPMLDDLGLLPTLLWYFEWIAQQYHLQVVFDHHGIERRFHSDLETTLYRVVQEALTNVARHAQVQTASVRLWANASNISVQIEDKGRGFNPDVALSHQRSIGLRGMRERVRLLGGQLVVEAEPGGGACLTALLPLTRKH